MGATLVFLELLSLSGTVVDGVPGLRPVFFFVIETSLLVRLVVGATLVFLLLDLWWVQLLYFWSCCH